MKNKQSALTIATLANGAELVARVIEKLRTDAISKTFAGAELSNQTVYDTAQVIFNQEINKKIEG